VGKHFTAWNLMLALIFVILFFAVLYPLLYIFKASFIHPETGAFSLKSYAAFFHYPYYLRCLRNSLFVSALGTLFALAIGIPFAFFLARYHVPGKNLLKTLGTLPLILPTFIGAEAWLILLGRNGLFAKLFQPFGIEIPSIYGWKGIVLVFALQFFPFIFLMVSSAINAIDRSLEEAATNLGSGRVRVFFTVTLPVITPSILSGGLVVFYLCIENFGVPVLIGEDFRVLSVQAYNEFISEMGGNPSMAGALSMVLLAITLSLTLLQKFWVERKSYAMTSLNPLEVKRLGPLATFLIWVFCAGVVFVALFPFAASIISSGPLRSPPGRSSTLSSWPRRPL
jgi:iron(III) transport system permease protein